MTDLISKTQSTYAAYGPLHPVVFFVTNRIKNSSYYTVGDFFKEIDIVTLETLFIFLSNFDKDMITCRPILSSYNIRNYYLLVALLAYGEGEGNLTGDNLMQATEAFSTLLLLERTIKSSPDAAKFVYIRKNYSLFDKNKIIATKKSGV